MMLACNRLLQCRLVRILCVHIDIEAAHFVHLMFMMSCRSVVVIPLVTTNLIVSDPMSCFPTGEMIPGSSRTVG